MDMEASRAGRHAALSERLIEDVQRSIVMNEKPFEYAVILPTYNERKNLPFVVALIDQAFGAAHAEDRYQVVVVDDASPDGTGRVALALQRAFGKERIVLAPRSGKLGLGTAYRHGLAHVSKSCTHVIIMDADLSHHPLAIPQFIAKMERTGADIVSGTRYDGQGGGVCGWDWKRKVTSTVANVLAQTLLAPKGLDDLTGSFRLYRRDVLERVLEHVHTRGYLFQVEAAVRATRQLGFRVEQVPIVFVDRMLYGESKLGGRELFEYLTGMVRLFLVV